MGSLAPTPLTEQLDQGKLEVKTQRDFQDLVGRNIKVLQDALVEGKNALGAYVGATLKQGYRQQPVRLNNGGLSWPDHSIYLDEHPPVVLIIGLCKPSTKWSLDELEDDPIADTLWPFRQLAVFCRKRDTRYGYIQTDKVLVACRFSRAECGIKYDVEYMPVPWGRDGPEVLTTDLAVWWLAMMGLNAQHRAIVPGQQMRRITEWDPANVAFNLGDSIQQHHISNRLVSTSSLGNINIGIFRLV